jgi:LPXTG-site transpeptidase (sortase) family protein
MALFQDDTRSPYASKLEEQLVFVLVFFGVLSLTYSFFFLIDFLPEKPSEKTEETITENRGIAKNDSVMIETEDTESDVITVIDPYPTRIIFDALDNREVVILNPESQSIEALDTALLSGVVRHPDSADFARVGTIFLFGHSSYLPNVMNKNFQAFNGIQKLAWGDTIRLQSSDMEYVYRIDRVYEASANDAEVKIETGKAKLTLVTCDSFGSKSDRFIVEASLIESYERG